MTKRTLYFQHGWGFSRNFWEATAAHLPEYKIILNDSGYFGAGSFAFPQDEFFAIGHSLGFMQLLPKIEKSKHCLGLLGINGFACFTQKEDFLDGISPRILNRMQRNLERNPHQVLNDFYKTCGSKQEIFPEHDLEIEKLQSGLTTLADGDERETLTKLEREGKILGMLSGSQDPLPPAKAHWIKTQTEFLGGHLLPLTHPEFCATWLKQQLQLVKKSL